MGLFDADLHGEPPLFKQLPLSHATLTHVAFNAPSGYGTALAHRNAAWSTLLDPAPRRAASHTAHRDGIDDVASGGAGRAMLEAALFRCVPCNATFVHTTHAGWTLNPQTHSSVCFSLPY